MYNFFMHYFQFSIRILFLSLLVSIISFPLLAQEVITLQAALDSTMKNNLQIRQADFQSVITGQDVFQSRMNLLPTINGGASGRINGGSFFDEKTGTLGNTTNKSVDGNVSTSIVLFRGFQKVNEIAFNRYLLEADKSNAEQIRYDLQISVFTTFMEALTNRDLLEAARQQLSLSEKQFLVEEIQVETGNKTLADLSQAKSQVALDELNVTSAQNSYDLSILTLKQLMEMNPIREIILENPALDWVENIVDDYSPEEVFNQAFLFFPDIRRVEFNTLAAETNVKMAKGNYYPSLSLSGGLSSGYSTFSRDMSGDVFPFRQQLRNNFSQYIGLSLNIPIFNSLSSRIGVKKAEISLENAKVIEQQTKNSLNKIINQAVLDFRSAQKRFSSSEQAFIAMKETFTIIKERYDVGLANAIELGIAQTNMNKAEFDFISSKYNVLFRNKVIGYYLGKPLHF